MTPEDFNYFQQRVSRFISGSSSGIKSRSFGVSNIRKISLIPKRSLPKQLIDKFSKSTTGDDGISTTSSGVGSLGRITLNLEYTKNNLDKILEVISEDYKNTQEQNKKETEEYRKRIANRGRIFGKRELGDKKSDVVGTVKKYVGSFFSGAGGSIRALAMFNLLQGILSGDPSKIIGPLLGITATYIPNIVAGMVGGLSTKLLGSLLRGGGSAAGAAGAGAAAGSRLGSLGRFAGKAGLVAGGIGLASSLLGNRDGEQQTQQRLSELTAQQKSLTEPSSITAIPQNELKKFDDLNKKFESALDFLLKRQNETNTSQSKSTGGGGGGGSSTPPSGGGAIPQELLESGIPENMARYLTRLSYLETRLRNVPNAQGSGAMGYYQAMEAFTQEAIKASGGLNPRSANFAESSKAVMSWIYVHNKPAYDAIVSGDYNRADDLLKYTWPSLPSGDQAQPGSVQKEANKFLKKSPSVLNSVSDPIVEESIIEPAPRSTSLSAPSQRSPSVMLVPTKIDSKPKQSSASAIGNDPVPSFSTTYNDNFLTLYSKLTYQIV